MGSFLHDHFLLDSDLAQTLYHEIAAPFPIIDFHNHLSPERVASNKPFSDLSDLWLDGDHYKWRAMRACGIDESQIMGNASPFEKFQSWAKVLPQTLCNPLYVWSHLELRRTFGINEILNPKSADAIWAKANELLQDKEFTPRQMLQKMNVKLIGTTDDPVDSLEHHQSFASEKNEDLIMAPTFRPDQAFATTGQENWNRWIDRLGAVCNSSIENLDDLKSAFSQRVDFYHTVGCRMADHGLSTVPIHYNGSAAAQKSFETLKSKSQPTIEDLQSMQIEILIHLCELYCQKSWTAQFHFGALRNPNESAYKKLGADSGFDAMGGSVPISAVANLLSIFYESNNLPSTILYNINPVDNYAFSTLCGSFQKPGKAHTVRHGAAWWFLDQKSGIEQQLDSWAQTGLLSHFPGMVTDSRSFLSFPRHEYFRRILCSWIAKQANLGIIPDDLDVLENLLKKVCLENARELFQNKNL